MIDIQQQTAVNLLEPDLPKGGMLVNVYRPYYDATNKGVSSMYDLFVLVGKGIPEVFEPSDRNPALYLKMQRSGLYIAIPDKLEEERFGWMMGGNFVFTSDGRFRAINDYPIPIHDRRE